MSRRPVRRIRLKKRIRRLTLAGLALCLAAALAAVWGYAGPGPAARSGEATTVVVQRGTGLAGISRRLADAGVIRSATLFAIAARLTGAAGELKAGEYAFPSHRSMARVLADVRAGRVIRHLITIPEGWTSAMAAEAVNRAPVLSGRAEAPSEGAILPDTYQVERGDDRAAVIARMVAARGPVLDELWAQRRPGLPLHSPQEAVILASIVERETALAAERPRIAAVFINRLRSGMRLESDPTVIYGISEGRPLGRGLTVGELARPTPYNTYLVDGLPPTPIANPGRAALAAVLNPPHTDELFFVADGTGGHVFAATFAEHQANVARWRRIERARSMAAAGAGR